MSWPQIAQLIVFVVIVASFLFAFFMTPFVQRSRRLNELERGLALVTLWLAPFILIIATITILDPTVES